jgi:hypothetical protein
MVFSTLVIPNSHGALNPNPPSQEHQPHIDSLPSFPIASSSLSSSLPGESINTSN